MYEKITLDNGVRLLFEHIPYVRSAALGIWVGSGSRYERASENGASHFIEHMVFKGTKTRSASDLAELMDAVGGQTNAFTTKECTVFYGRVLDTHLDLLSDVLTDMFFHSKFDEADVINERSVVFEEIDMYADTPEDLAAERLFTACFKGSGLARPILGTRSTLKKLTGEGLRQYAETHYIPQNVVVALAGSFSDKDVETLKAQFGQMKPGSPLRMTRATYTPSFTVKRKAIEQNHLCLGFPGLRMNDSRRYALALMSTILGGGMSSRLFQTVREKNGLCYSVYSFSSNYSDVGMFNVYTAVGRESEEKALRLILDELDRIAQHGVTIDELDRAREQVKSNVLMGLESTEARMNRLGKCELFHGHIPEAEEAIALYDAVSLDDIRAICEYCFEPARTSLSAVGRVEAADRYRELLTK